MRISGDFVGDLRRFAFDDSRRAFVLQRGGAAGGFAQKAFDRFGQELFFAAFPKFAQGFDSLSVFERIDRALKAASIRARAALFFRFQYIPLIILRFRLRSNPRRHRAARKTFQAGLHPLGQREQTRRSRTNPEKS